MCKPTSRAQVNRVLFWDISSSLSLNDNRHRTSRRSRRLAEDKDEVILPFLNKEDDEHLNYFLPFSSATTINIWLFPKSRFLKEGQFQQLRWYPHLEFLPELRVPFFISFWNGHVVVLTFFLVKQLVPLGDTGEKNSQVLCVCTTPGSASPVPSSPVQLLPKCIPWGDYSQLTP